METKENGLAAFSDETLSEMAMENLEGGGDGLSINVPKCGTTNNCSAGNCIAGCGSNNCPLPPPAKPIE